ncbi:MAG: hypothetical protein ABID04_00635 [Patescibacteria group bacterium]
MKSSLPSFVSKYFWGDNLSELNWDDHSEYITQTLLEMGDQKAVDWLMKKTSKQQLYKQLPSIKLSPKSANFWKIYLS